MHNTTGDVALTNMSEKQIISVILSSIQNKSSPPFLRLGYVLGMFLNFEQFSASRSYIECYYKTKIECTLLSLHNYGPGTYL